MLPAVPRAPRPSTIVVIPGLVLAVVASACFVEAGEVCCASDFDCVAGARCFEGSCALSCDEDGQCAEGEACVGDVGVCRLTRRDAELRRCPYGEPAGGDEGARR